MDVVGFLGCLKGHCVDFDSRLSKHTLLRLSEGLGLRVSFLKEAEGPTLCLEGTEVLREVLTVGVVVGLIGTGFKEEAKRFLTLKEEGYNKARVFRCCLAMDVFVLELQR